MLARRDNRIVLRDEPVYTVKTYDDPYYPSNPPYDDNMTITTDEPDFTVEYPPDGGTRGWLVVLACAGLHMCAELVHAMIYGTILIANYRNPRLASANLSVVDTYTEFMVFEDVSLTGEIIGALLSVMMGYRATSFLGSICTLGGLVGSSWVNPSKHLEVFHFLTGFLGGIGVAFWRFTAYVAVMEYFRANRTVALALSGLGRAVGMFIGYGVMFVPLITVAEESIKDVRALAEWWMYYRVSFILPVLAALAALAIQPLKHAYPQTPTPWRMYKLKLHDTWLCRYAMLMFVVAVYFIYYFGQTLPGTTIFYLMGSASYSIRESFTALFVLAAGWTLGCLLLFVWPKKQKMWHSLSWMAAVLVAMGLITLVIPRVSKGYLSYMIAYTALLGIGQAVFELVLRQAIPIGFGRTHLKWIEGLLGLAAGVATICNNFVAREIAKHEPDYLGNIFYLAGAASVTAGVLIAIAMIIRVCYQTEDINMEDNPPEPPKQPPKVVYRREPEYIVEEAESEPPLRIVLEEDDYASPRRPRAIEYKKPEPDYEYGRNRPRLRDDRDLYAPRSRAEYR